MALTRSLKVYNGSDATPVTDVTDRTDWPQTELSGLANLGDAAAGQWLMRDEGGTIPDLLSPGELLDSHNVVVATVGSNTLFRGRIAADDNFRGRQKAGRAKEITFTLEDQNSHLRGIIVHEWIRPAETDAARAQALVAAYLSGSPRATTNLNGSNLIITGSNAISLPAKTYSGVTPYEVMQELASTADKEMFVSVDNELAYFGHDYTGYASLLRISDALTDANATTYAPWNPHGAEIGRNKLSALRTYFGSDVTQSTVRVTNSNAPRFDYWEDVFWDSESVTPDQAAIRAQKMLDYRTTNDVSYTCTIGPMSGDEIWKIKPGHSIQFKSRAARGGRNANGTYSGDNFLVTRVRQLNWTMPDEDRYLVRVEMEKPKQASKPSQGNQALAIMPAPSPGTVECDCTDDFTREATNNWGLSPIQCLPWHTHADFLPANGATASSVNGSFATQVSDGSTVHVDWIDLKGWDGTTAEFLVKTRFTESVYFQIEKSGIYVGDGGIGQDGATKFRWALGIDGLGEVFASLIATEVSSVGVSLGASSVETGATGQWLWARCHLEDLAIRINVWKDGDSEPAGWNAEIAYSGGPTPSFLGATTGIPLCDLFQVIGTDADPNTIEVDSIEMVSGIDCSGRTPVYMDDPAGGDLAGTYPNPTIPHVTDTSAAHAASSVAFTPNGSISSTDVQAAIQEVRDEATGGGGSGPFEDAGGGPTIWNLITGASSLESTDSSTDIRLDTDQLILSNFTDGSEVRLESGLISLTSPFGVIVPIASTDPAGGDSNDGQVYYNNTSLRFRGYQNGVWVDLVRGALVSRTSAVAIANTETVVTNFSMPSGASTSIFMQAGTTFRIKAFGRLTSGVTAGSSIFRCRIGTTTLTGNIPATLTIANGASQTNAPFTVEMLVTVRTAGSSGTAIGNVEVGGGAVGAFTVADAISAISATVVVDTTATKLIELTYISGNSGTTATFENVVIELLQ